MTVAFSLGALTRTWALPYELLAKTLDLCRAALVMCDVRDPAQPVVYANPAFYALTGFSAAEVLGRDCSFLHGPQTESRARAQIGRAIAAGETLTTVLRNYRRDGSSFWNRLSVAPIRDDAGIVTHYVGMPEDVSDQLGKNHGLQMLLDGAGAAAEAGDTFIARCIAEALGEHTLTGRQHALLELRVDISAEGGAALGLLQREDIGACLAARLRHLIPARASMACLSDLRFAVVLPLIAAHEEAEMMATGLLAELPVPLESRLHAVQVRVAAGIALLPQDGREAAQLLAAVEHAADKGMRSGEEPLQFVSPGLNLGRASLRLLEFDLRNALAKNQLRLVFQPQVHLATGSVVGFEALLRWQHPLRGDIPRAQFIPIVESCGMAGVVTRWVIEQSLAQLRVWEDQGHRGLQVGVNTPPSVFENGEIESFLHEQLARYEISGSQIQFELTERTLTDAGPAVIERLQSLRGHGVSVAIDDFGTGHSNLNCLTRLPLDCLKLDLSFVQGAVSNPSDAMVARMTCQLARALKLRIVVEGVETQGQFQLFSDLGCDLAQGYFFARPLEVPDADALLHSGRSFPQRSIAQERPRHLLLLDDEPNILRALRRVFRAQAWQVHTAHTPDEAFELLARHPVGVVMSDQRMPLIRGTDFLARVKQLYPDTVRIILSGYTELQSVTEAVNEGAIYKFLTKPWDDRNLNEEIERAFQQFELVAESQVLQQRLRDSNRLLESRLQHNEQRLQREEAALDVTHEALSVVPVPVLGIDAGGMIAISNAAADRLFGEGSSVVGGLARQVLPGALAELLDGPAGDAPRRLRIGDTMYEVRCNDLGATSRGSGTVVTLLHGGRA